jgi:hypothetical protein
VVFKVAKRGGSRLVIATPSNEIMDLAVDGNDVYYQDYTTPSVLYRQPKKGGPATRVANGLYNPGTLMIRGGRLLWLSPVEILSVELRGGAPTVLHRCRDVPMGLALDAGGMYFGEGEEVLKVPLHP